MQFYKIGIIGAGLQAQRRIPAILQSEVSKIVGITSKTKAKAQQLSEKYGITLYNDWQDMIKNKNIDIVVITTYPDSHAEIAIKAMENGMHVLCEKPLARTTAEARKMNQAAKKNKRILKCGFNHRFHPAMQEVKKIIDSDRLGKLLFGRGVYGHCGRPGFEKEWRTNKKYSAGGILMEQGIHLVDLFNWYFGNFSQVFSICQTMYFPINSLEDSAFVLLKTKDGQTINIHSTNMEWKNKFLLEIFGTEGYVRIEGIGESYGTQKLVIGKKNYSGPFLEEIYEYRGTNISWRKEWEEFIETIEKNSGVLNNSEGVESMRLIDAAYESSKKGIVIPL